MIKFACQTRLHLGFPRAVAPFQASCRFFKAAAVAATALAALRGLGGGCGGGCGGGGGIAGPALFLEETGLRCRGHGQALTKALSVASST